MRSVLVETRKLKAMKKSDDLNDQDLPKSRVVAIQLADDNSQNSENTVPVAIEAKKDTDGNEPLNHILICQTSKTPPESATQSVPSPESNAESFSV